MLLPPIVRRIPEITIAGRRLGRHVEHDPRSRAFVHPDPAHVKADDPAPALHSRLWHHYGPILNQGELGSCTGNAGAQLLNCEPFANGKALLTEADAVALYEEATTLDNIPGQYPPSDTGSTGIAVAKAMQKRGRVGTYRHAFTLLSALSWLSTRGPFLLGIEWLSSFDTPHGGDAELVLTPGATVRGGHEVCIIGIDASRRLVRGLNSWGDGWGDHGRFCMSWDLLGVLLSRQGDATLPELPAAA